MDALDRSKLQTQKIHTLLTKKEAQLAAEHTSEIRAICPKTGEYIPEEQAVITRDMEIAHKILNFRGSRKDLLRIKFKCRDQGFKSLSEGEKRYFMSQVNSPQKTRRNSFNQW